MQIVWKTEAKFCTFCPTFIMLGGLTKLSNNDDDDDDDDDVD